MLGSKRKFAFYPRALKTAAPKISPQRIPQKSRRASYRSDTPTTGTSNDLMKVASATLTTITNDVLTTVASDTLATIANDVLTTVASDTITTITNDALTTVASDALTVITKNFFSKKIKENPCGFS